MSIKTLRKSLLALKTLHNSLTFPAPYLRSKHLCKEFPLFFCELATETYGRLLSWRTNLMWRRSVYDCFSDSTQNGCVIIAILSRTCKYTFIWCISGEGSQKLMLNPRGTKIYTFDLKIVWRCEKSRLPSRKIGLGGSLLVLSFDDIFKSLCFDGGR